VAAHPAVGELTLGPGPPQIATRPSPRRVLYVFVDAEITQSAGRRKTPTAGGHSNVSRFGLEVPRGQRQDLHRVACLSVSSRTDPVHHLKAALGPARRFGVTSRCRGSGAASGNVVLAVAAHAPIETAAAPRKGPSPWRGVSKRAADDQATHEGSARAPSPNCETPRRGSAGLTRPRQRRQCRRLHHPGPSRPTTGNFIQVYAGGPSRPCPFMWIELITDGGGKNKKSLRDPCRRPRAVDMNGSSSRSVRVTRDRDRRAARLQRGGRCQDRRDRAAQHLSAFIIARSGLPRRVAAVILESSSNCARPGRRVHRRRPPPCPRERQGSTGRQGCPRSARRPSHAGVGERGAQPVERSVAVSSRSAAEPTASAPGQGDRRRRSSSCVTAHGRPGWVRGSDTPADRGGSVQDRGASS